MTESLCRREYKIIYNFHLFYGINAFVLFHVLVNLYPNPYRMPFNCYIFFIPFDAFSYAWALNYFLIMVMTFFMGLFFMCYVPLPLVLMNQTCWLLDLTLKTAEEMNLNLQASNAVIDQGIAEKFNEDLRKVIARCRKVVKWRNEVQNLLFWNFSLEFQIQSIILGVSIYSLSLEFFGSDVVRNIFTISLVQLFLYCRMGSRVTRRIDQLSYDVSKNWHLIPPKQRKVLQMNLHRTQNMKGFYGMFKVVNLETFRSVRKPTFFFKM